MGVLADWQIRERMALPSGDPMRLVIDPFSEPVRVPGKLSWGLGHYGYDLRCGRNFLVFSDIAACEVDPLTLAENAGKFAVFKDVDSVIVPPNSFCLAESVEWFQVPRDCIGQVFGKSTLARCGCNLNMTVIEPEWRGRLTLEIINGTRLPLRIHADQGVGQIVFHRGDAECVRSYADKALEGQSNYQDQGGLTTPRVK